MPRLVLHQGREDETVFPLHEGLEHNRPGRDQRRVRAAQEPVAAARAHLAVRHRGLRRGSRQ